MGRVFIKNGRVMPGFPGFNLQDRKGRGGKSPSFRVGMKAESFPWFLLTITT